MYTLGTTPCLRLFLTGPHIDLWRNFSYGCQLRPTCNILFFEPPQDHKILYQKCQWQWEKVQEDEFAEACGLMAILYGKSTVLKALIYMFI